MKINSISAISKSEFSNNFSDISTGTNRASSDVASMAIYEKMGALSSGLKQGISNTAAIGDLLNTAEGGLESISYNLQKIRTLSLQGSNGTLSKNEQQIINNEISSLMQGINSVASNTEFNGIKLLNGTFTNKNTASSPSGRGTQISIGNMSIGNQGLGILNFNKAGSYDINDIDKAMDKVNTARAGIGAISNSFGNTMNQNAVAMESLDAARSRLADTNIAKASINMNTANTLNQFNLLAQKKDFSKAKNLVEKSEFSKK